MNARRFILIACLGPALTLRAASLPAESAIDARDKAKREAWGYACLVVSILEQGDNTNFPGIRAWLGDFQQARAAIDAREPSLPFASLDSDTLVTRNPRFWAAYYETPAADPGLALLHSALLLSGGEAQRAAAIATFGLQRQGIPEDVKRPLGTVIELAQAAQSRSLALVREGVRLHDAREFASALEKYEEAIEDWPANGWAHYERGVTVRMKAMADSGKLLAKDVLPALEEPAADPPETREAFSEARRHDPFQIMAYQGAEAQLLDAFMVLVRKGLPVWEALRKHPGAPLSREQLRDLADACRAAEIEDFALAVRQLLISRGKRYQPEDQLFIAEGLQRLASEMPVGATLARLDSDPPMPARQIVVTGAENELAAGEDESARANSDEPSKKPVARSTSASKKSATKKSTAKKSPAKKATPKKSTAKSGGRKRKAS